MKERGIILAEFSIPCDWFSCSSHKKPLGIRSRRITRFLNTSLDIGTFSTPKWEKISFKLHTPEYAMATSVGRRIKEVILAVNQVVDVNPTRNPKELAKKGSVGAESQKTCGQDERAKEEQEQQAVRISPFSHENVLHLEPTRFHWVSNTPQMHYLHLL